MGPCTKCGKGPVGYDLHDYCGDCGDTLCTDCMKGGCCGVTPAASGMEADHDE